MLVRRLLCLLALLTTAGCFTFFSAEKLKLDHVRFGAERVEKVFFDSEKHDLKASGKRLVLELVEQMKYDRDMYLVVVGHTDAVGTDEDNMALGERRANAVKAFIESCDKSLSSRVITYSKGKSEPEVLVYSSDSDDIEKAYSHNRRAVIMVRFGKNGAKAVDDMSHLMTSSGTSAQNPGPGKSLRVETPSTVAESTEDDGSSSLDVGALSQPVKDLVSGEEDDDAGDGSSHDEGCEHNLHE